MSGLVKAKKYDWKDSNLALFGSDTEKQVKKESAQTEPAWQGAGEDVGIQIWRIVKFKITHWPREQYGSFYSGDSYIILNTYKEEDSKELKYDVHFWIGKESTQDEYGTAAYKTVELDTFLNDAPVQHREVEQYESSLFKSYFKTLTYMKGGADTGFRHVKPEEYKPRLFHVTGDKKNVKVTEVAMQSSKITSDDVYILDQGEKLLLWRGNGCNKDEKIKAVQYMQQLKSDRHGKSSTEFLDEGDGDDEFFSFIKEHEEEGDDDDDEIDDSTQKLLRLSDSGGQMTRTLEKEGSVISRRLLDSKDVFILDTKQDLFIWTGRRCSKNERKNAFSYAHDYLQTTKHPMIPITVLKEGQTNEKFSVALVA